MMIHTKTDWKDLSATAEVSVFETAGGAAEYHAMVSLNNPLDDAVTQYRNIETAIERLQQDGNGHCKTLVLKRYFVSDAINHASLLSHNDNVAVSIVQQPPLNGTKVAVWAYWVEDCTVKSTGENAVVMERPHYQHLYNMQMHSHGEDEYIQTLEICKHYSRQLERRQCSLKENTIRTWIYVQGVDTHYADMVKARRRYFKQMGLTEDTHYIASTGIEGRYLHPETTVLIDAYSITGIKEEQITYLKGATHLNPTHEYGVTFERATAVDYGDRRHIFVSGTASIDNRGEIVHPLQIDLQTQRTLENISILLAEADTNMDDIAQMIVYLRDTADYVRVSQYLQQTCPQIPKVIVWAPVCRPGWLIEIECIAVKSIHNDGFGKF
jgi:enamine deaminase RidA (YjgF/YER057c/UK114 family)